MACMVTTPGLIRFRDAPGGAPLLYTDPWGQAGAWLAARVGHADGAGADAGLVQGGLLRDARLGQRSSCDDARGLRVGARTGDSTESPLRFSLRAADAQPRFHSPIKKVGAGERDHLADSLSKDTPQLR